MKLWPGTWWLCVNIYQATLPHIPEKSIFHVYSGELH